MALIKCPECGKEMSDYAESCPGCAMPMTVIRKILADKAVICVVCGAEVIASGVTAAAYIPADIMDFSDNSYDRKKEELITLLETLGYCYLNREEELGQGKYDCSEADDFGVLQAIMRDCLMSDAETYADICPIDLNYRRTSTEDGMDPEKKAASISFSFYEVDADAVNWIAKNIFNASDESIQRELEYSSSLTSGESFFYPLYRYEDKYYYCPGQWGGLYTVEILPVYIPDQEDADGYYTVSYMQGLKYQTTDWFNREAKLKYKTENGKGYWSVYKDYLKEE